MLVWDQERSSKNINTCHKLKIHNYMYTTKKYLQMGLDCIIDGA